MRTRMPGILVSAFGLFITTLLQTGCGQRPADKAPAVAAATAETPASSTAPVAQPGQAALQAERREQLLEEMGRSVSCSGALAYEPKRSYAFEGFAMYGNTTRYYVNAWNVTVTLSNSSALNLQLGDTLIVLEESTEGETFLAGSLKHDGYLESNHIWRIEERYALDSYASVARSGECKEQPTIAGSSYGFVASETGEPMAGEFVMTFRKVDPWPGYSGYGYGILPAASSLMISNPILMGTGFKASYLHAAYVAVPALHAQQEGVSAAGRFILRFESETVASPTGSVVGEIHPPMRFAGAEFVPMRGSNLLAMAMDGSRGIVERTLALNWLGELNDAQYEPQFAKWMKDRILPLLLRRAAAWHLSRIDTETARAALLQTFADADTPYTLRAACAAALADLKVTAASESLLALLQNPQTPPMPGFFYAARVLGDKRFGAPLASLLPLQSHTSMVSSIAYALTTTVDSNTVAPLAEAARKGNEDVCTKALYYLGQTHCAEGAAALKDLALSPSFTNRGKAISSLGVCDVPESQAALIELLGHPACTGFYYQIISGLRPTATGGSTDIASIFGRGRSGKTSNAVEKAAWDRTPATDALADFAGKHSTNQLSEVMMSLAALPATAKGTALIELILKATNAPASATSGACNVARAWRLSKLSRELDALARNGDSNVVAAAVLAITDISEGADESLYRRALEKSPRFGWPAGFKLLIDDLVNRKPDWAAKLLVEQLQRDDSVMLALDALGKLADESAPVRDAVRSVAQSDRQWTTRNEAIVTLCALRDPSVEWFETMYTNRNLTVEAQGACLLALARNNAEIARPLLLPAITNGFASAMAPTIDAVSAAADDVLTEAAVQRLPEADEAEVVKLAEALTATKNSKARDALQRELLVAGYSERTREAIRRSLAGEKPVRP